MEYAVYEYELVPLTHMFLWKIFDLFEKCFTHNLKRILHVYACLLRVYVYNMVLKRTVRNTYIFYALNAPTTHVSTGILQQASLFVGLMLP